MDAELKAKWVAELRSGKYQQCTGFLKDGESYCCLGVLHKTMTGEEPPKAWDGDDDEPKHGLTGTQRHTCIAMNDGTYGERLHSFAEIADWIDANL